MRPKGEILKKGKGGKEKRTIWKTKNPKVLTYHRKGISAITRLLVGGGPTGLSHKRKEQGESAIKKIGKEEIRKVGQKKKKTKPPKLGEAQGLYEGTQEKESSQKNTLFEQVEG